MKIPNLASVQNIVGVNLSNFLGGWTVLDHDTQMEVCTFDSFFAFGYDRTATVTQYPIENGSFATYNKQNNPLRLSISLVKNGLNFPFQKQSFIKALQTYTQEPKYVDIVTPSGTYLNCTLSNLSFENTADEWADSIKASLQVSEVMHVGGSIGSKKVLNASTRIYRGLRSLVGI